MALSRWASRLLSIATLLGFLLSPLQSLAMVSWPAAIQTGAVGPVDQSSLGLTQLFADSGRGHGGRPPTPAPEARASEEFLA